MEINYRENIEKKVNPDNVKKSENGKYSTADIDGKFCYILSENTDNLEVIAVIVNHENNTEKWVAAEKGVTFIEPVIRDIIGDKSEDEYFCLYEKTCGSIVFIRKRGVKYYLLVENHTGHIGFPKGHIELGETDEECAVREVFEETFLNIEINPETRQEFTYRNRQGIVKNCIYYYSEFTEELIRLQEGEIIRCWLVPYNEAFQLLNYPNDKIIFQNAEKNYG